MTSFEGSGRSGDVQGLVAPDNEATLGRALVQRRLQLSLGPVDAATALGVSRSTYVAYEHDERRLAPEALRGVALFLDVGLARVLEYYGTTCVAQARRSLLRDAEEGSTSTVRSARTAVRRRAHGDELKVVQRVYFDDSTPSPRPSDGAPDVSEARIDRNGVEGSAPVTSRGIEEPASSPSAKQRKSKKRPGVPKQASGEKKGAKNEKKGAKKRGKKKGASR